MKEEKTPRGQERRDGFRQGRRGDGIDKRKSPSLGTRLVNRREIDAGRWTVRSPDPRGDPALDPKERGSEVPDVANGKDVAFLLNWRINNRSGPIPQEPTGEDTCCEHAWAITKILDGVQYETCGLCHADRSRLMATIPPQEVRRAASKAPSARQQFAAHDKVRAFEESSTVDASVLETFAYEYAGIERGQVLIKNVTEEFTSVCPFSGLPDFATITISYEPGSKCIELRSLKYYLMGYRNVGIWYEHLVNKLLHDLVDSVEPKSMVIELDVASRGGIVSQLTATYDREVDEVDRVIDSLDEAMDRPVEPGTDGLAQVRKNLQTALDGLDRAKSDDMNDIERLRYTNVKARVDLAKGQSLTVKQPMRRVPPGKHEPPRDIPPPPEPMTGLQFLARWGALPHTDDQKNDPEYSVDLGRLEPPGLAFEPMTQEQFEQKWGDSPGGSPEDAREYATDLERVKAAELEAKPSRGIPTPDQVQRIASELADQVSPHQPPDDGLTIEVCVQCGGRLPGDVIYVRGDDGRRACCSQTCYADWKSSQPPDDDERVQQTTAPGERDASQDEAQTGEDQDDPDDMILPEVDGALHGSDLLGPPPGPASPPPPVRDKPVA